METRSGHRLEKSFTTELAGLMIGSTVTPGVAAYTRCSDLMGFIAGCCIGPRAGAAYNDGRKILWREWCHLLPQVGIAFAVGDGIDGAYGVATTDFTAR